MFLFLAIDNIRVFSVIYMNKIIMYFFIIFSFFSILVYTCSITRKYNHIIYFLYLSEKFAWICLLFLFYIKMYTLYSVRIHFIRKRDSSVEQSRQIGAKQMNSIILQAIRRRLSSSHLFDFYFVFNVLYKFRRRLWHNGGRNFLCLNDRRYTRELCRYNIDLKLLLQTDLLQNYFLSFFCTCIDIAVSQYMSAKYCLLRLLLKNLE